MAKLTLLDLAKRSGNDASIGIVESMGQLNAFWKLAPVREIQGMMYKYARRKSLPTVSFRGTNQGVVPSKSVIENIIVECKNIFGASEVDKALADGYKDGASAFRAIEDAGFLAAAANTFNSKVYYGNSATTPAEIDGIGTILNTVTGTAVSAGGSTGSSMYFFSFTDAVGIEGRLPGVEVPIANGMLPKATDLGVQLVYETSSTTAKYPAYTTIFEFCPGLAVYDTRSVGRLANIDSTHKPTVAQINEVITAMMPYNVDLITCSKTTFNYVQLLKGSSAFQQTSPYESDDIFKRASVFNGIPILVDENISDSETAIS